MTELFTLKSANRTRSLLPRPSHPPPPPPPHRTTSHPPPPPLRRTTSQDNLYQGSNIVKLIGDDTYHIETDLETCYSQNPILTPGCQETGGGESFSSRNLLRRAPKPPVRSDSLRSLLSDSSAVITRKRQQHEPDSPNLSRPASTAFEFQPPSSKDTATPSCPAGTQNKQSRSVSPVLKAMASSPKSTINNDEHSINQIGLKVTRTPPKPPVESIKPTRPPPNPPTKKEHNILSENCLPKHILVVSNDSESVRLSSSFENRFVHLFQPPQSFPCPEPPELLGTCTRIYPSRINNEGTTLPNFYQSLGAPLCTSTLRPAPKIPSQHRSCPSLGAAAHT
jgi:hypothetical protein